MRVTCVVRILRRDRLHIAWWIPFRVWSFGSSRVFAQILCLLCSPRCEVLLGRRVPCSVSTDATMPPRSRLCSDKSSTWWGPSAAEPSAPMRLLLRTRLCSNVSAARGGPSMAAPLAPMLLPPRLTLCSAASTLRRGPSTQAPSVMTWPATCWEQGAHKVPSLPTKSDQQRNVPHDSLYM